jgi:rhamnogalacturonyl hydrolase YesR
VGSRGAVLVELGRHGEGKALLDTLVQADDTAPFDALMMSCLFLARAEQALGNPTAASELMTKVTKTRAAIAAHGEIDPALIGLIERIDRETHTSQ